MIYPSILEYSHPQLDLKIKLLNKHHRGEKISLHLDFVFPEFAKLKKVLSSLDPESVFEKVILDLQNITKFDLTIHFMGTSLDEKKYWDFIDYLKKIDLEKVDIKLFVPENCFIPLGFYILSKQLDGKIILGTWFDYDNWDQDYEKGRNYLLMSVPAGKSRQKMTFETKRKLIEIGNNNKNARFLLDGGWGINSIYEKPFSKSENCNIDIVSYSSFWNYLHILDNKIHDSHVHLDYLLEKIQAKDGENQIEKLKKMITSHKFLIHSTCSNDNFTKVLEIFKGEAGFENVYFLYGSHPDIADKNFDIELYLSQQKEIIKKLNLKIEQKSVIGIGEIGLDYFENTTIEIKNIQKKLLISQITLAKKLKLNIVFHVRNAFDDFFEILDSEIIDYQFIVHCFTGNCDNFLEIKKRGGKIGLGGILTFKKNGDLEKVVEIMGENDFVLETDLPFLSPIPFRGETCLPNYIIETANKIAQIQKTSEISIFEKSEKNILQIFPKINF